MSRIARAASGYGPDYARSLGRTPRGVVAWAMTQAGDPYILGAEAQPGNVNPAAFDCSELVEWSCARVGVTITDGAYAQFVACKRAGRLISVQEAIETPGALLFVSKCGSCGGGRGNHVAISQGNGKTIEARGRRYGVGEFPANRKVWTHGGLIPGLNYSSKAPVSMPTMDTAAFAAFLRAVLITIKLCSAVPIRRGATGECVKAVQTRLKVLGYPVPVDGVYGRRTQASVQKFQQRNSINPSGTVGPITWKSLFPDVL